MVAGGGGTLPAKFVNGFKARPGTALVSTDVSGREAHNWVGERITRAPLNLAPAAAAMVESHLGEDLSRLSSLLATLEAAYGTGATVGPDELEPYLGQPGSVPPWDLTDAIDKGETETALKVLHRLMEAGDRHPLVVLAILHRHFGNILRVQSPAISSEGGAAEALGIAKGRSTFPARKALDAARRLGPGGSGDAVIALADAELALKGKLDWEPEVVLEVLVAGYAGFPAPPVAHRLWPEVVGGAPGAKDQPRVAAVQLADQPRHGPNGEGRRRVGAELFRRGRAGPGDGGQLSHLAHEGGLAVGGLVAVDDAACRRLVQPLHSQLQVLGGCCFAGPSSMDSPS